jgi:hypothetical protein
MYTDDMEDRGSCSQATGFRMFRNDVKDSSNKDPDVVVNDDGSVTISNEPGEDIHYALEFADEIDCNVHYHLQENGKYAVKFYE